MRLGQRFESARRLSLLPIDKPKTRNEEALGDLPGASLHHRYITCRLGASSRKEAVEEARTTGSSSLPTKPPISPRGKRAAGMQKRLLYATLPAVHYARGESNGKQRRCRRGADF